MEEWFSNQASGYVGGGIGVVCGLLGGLVGSTSHYFISKGKKKLMYGIFITVIVMGALSAITGIVALFCKQPYHVFYPFLLSGLLIVAIFGGLLPVMKYRFTQQEMKKMSAKDL